MTNLIQQFVTNFLSEGKMIIKRSKSTASSSSSSKKIASSSSSSINKNVRSGTELLVVTRNELGSFAKLANVLTKNKVNIECFTGYEWGGEAAFRLVTDNNKKASSVISQQGFTVTESPVVLWYTSNDIGTISAASQALAKANINTYCTYSSTPSESVKKANTVIAFNTSNPEEALNVISNLG